jgi:D-glycero-alpha-D-manno-heptose-7-phosphate kinase
MIIRSKAPLRLGLAGGGTDVSPYSDEFGGNVLNVTIDMYAYCSIKITNNNKISFISVDRDEKYESEAKSFLELDGNLDLHKGVYNKIVKLFNNNDSLSFEMFTYSDAPAGSGLGSSSTMVVAMLKAFQEWLSLPLGEYDLAKLAYDIERIDIGLSGGKQDQYAATFGGFNFIEFYSNDRVIVNPLRIKNWIINELESSLILYYTGTSRSSAKIIDEQIKSTSTHNSRSLEGMHELKKSALIMKEALLKGDFDGFAECLKNGWESKKKTSSSISNFQIDELYEFIMKNGGKAAKISGAGGGGFMMIICDPIKRYKLVEKLKNTSGKVMLASFTEKGSKSWRIY